jgi:hypothetical protein
VTPHAGPLSITTTRRPQSATVCGQMMAWTDMVKGTLQFLTSRLTYFIFFHPQPFSISRYILNSLNFSPTPNQLAMAPSARWVDIMDDDDDEEMMVQTIDAPAAVHKNRPVFRLNRVEIKELGNNISHFVVVRSFDTVGFLRTRIEGQTSVPTECQRLFFGTTLLVADDLTMCKHNIWHGTILHLVDTRSIHVTVSASADASVELVVFPSMLVSILLERLQGLTGCDMQTVRLSFGIYALQGNRTLAHYNIQEGSQIRMHVRTRGGSTVMFTIEDHAELFFNGDDSSDGEDSQATTIRYEHDADDIGNLDDTHDSDFLFAQDQYEYNLLWNLSSTSLPPVSGYQAGGGGVGDNSTTNCIHVPDRESSSSALSPPVTGYQAGGGGVPDSESSSSASLLPVSGYQVKKHRTKHKLVLTQA